MIELNLYLTHTPCQLIHVFGSDICLNRVLVERDSGELLASLQVSCFKTFSTEIHFKRTSFGEVVKGKVDVVQLHQL
jgi:hypothetical protein